MNNFKISWPKFVTSFKNLFKQTTNIKIQSILTYPQVEEQFRDRRYKFLFLSSKESIRRPRATSSCDVKPPIRTSSLGTDSADSTILSSCCQSFTFLLPNKLLAALLIISSKPTRPKELQLLIIYSIERGCPPETSASIPRTVSRLAV